MRKILTVFFLTCAALSIPVTVSALGVSVRQVIRQISCVLTTVVHDDGTSSYVLSPGCGHFIVPLVAQPTASNTLTSPFALPTEGEAAKIFLRQQNIYLASDHRSQPPGGYVLLASAGMRYGFRLTGESNMVHDRTMEIVSTDIDAVTVRFWPGGQQVVIHLDETVKVQVAYDATPDIVMTLMQLNADGSVLLRVHFPEQQQLADSAKGQTDVYVATVLGLTAATLFLCVYLDYWILARRSLPPKDWWPLHDHDPFV